MKIRPWWEAKNWKKINSKLQLIYNSLLNNIEKVTQNGRIVQVLNSGFALTEPLENVLGEQLSRPETCSNHAGGKKKKRQLQLLKYTGYIRESLHNKPLAATGLNTRI